MGDARWKESVQEGIRALEDNGTWTLEPLPSEKRVLGSQWVYFIKYLANHEVECLKSHLIVFGKHQEAGIDYNKSFSLVAKMTIVRAFLAKLLPKTASSIRWMSIMPFYMAFLKKKSLY